MKILKSIETLLVDVMIGKTVVFSLLTALRGN